MIPPDFREAIANSTRLMKYVLLLAHAAVSTLDQCKAQQPRCLAAVRAVVLGQVQQHATAGPLWWCEARDLPKKTTNTI